jgi:adenylate cyclase
MTEERVKRKLSAILSADVVGYSRLMGEDEVSTVRTLEAYRRVMSDLIEQFRGRVVDSPGDNLLSEFSSVVDAVQCAVEIHEVIRAKNEELPEDRQMLFRIGVYLGDVIEEGDRIYGDGVNIAARLEGLAEAGGICISGSAHEQIENKLALGYEYLGEHTVKNIAKPVKVYKVPMGPKVATPKEGDDKETKLKKWRWTAIGAVGVIIIIVALAIWSFYFRTPSIEPEQASVTSDVKESAKTIAVLPFVNLSSDPEQEYFVDGLSEELLNSLTKIPDLLVTARTSSFAFKGTDKTIKEISTVLGVDNILEGSVRKAGNSLRITAQLIRSVDGFHLWSETYDRELKDIFAVQEDIAKAVANELKLTLGIGKSLKQLGGTDNMEAYEIYLVARGTYSLGELATYSRMLELLDRAIVLDPEFASAWALKADIHRLRAGFVSANESVAERDLAISAAQRAIKLEPTLADGYYSLASIIASKGDWIEAESAYRKGMELLTEPTDYYYITPAYFHYQVGHLKKTNELLVIARQSDPLNVDARSGYIQILGILGDYKRFDEEYELANKLLKDRWAQINIMNMWLVGLGDYDSISRDKMIWSHPVSDIGKKYVDSPKKGLTEMHRIYTEDKNLSSSENIYVSLWAAYFGDSEFALDAFEKGMSIHSGGLFVIWYPAMRETRKTPRFKKFVREIGLVDYWKEYGWPDLCRPVGDDDFVCD